MSDKLDLHELGKHIIETMEKLDVAMEYIRPQGWCGMEGARWNLMEGDCKMCYDRICCERYLLLEEVKK